MPDTAMIEAPQTEVAVQGESSAIMSLIERAARDESVDIDKMERLFQMHERMTAKQAERDFHEAFAEMQTELPEIGKRGAAVNSNGKELYAYAKWENVNEVIKPILSKYGFGLSFRIEPNEKGLLITARLSRGGHTESTSIVQSLDMGGAAMNANQSRGAATSYGKRYTAGALLNLVFGDEKDTDGATPASGEPITADQVKQIRDALAKLGQKDDVILAWAGTRGIGATELENMPAEGFEQTIGQLNHWLKVRGKNNG